MTLEIITKIQTRRSQLEARIDAIETGRINTVREATAAEQAGDDEAACNLWSRATDLVRQQTDIIEQLLDLLRRETEAVDLFIAMFGEVPPAPVEAAHN